VLAIIKAILLIGISVVTIPSPQGSDCQCVASTQVTVACTGGGSITFAYDAGFPKSRDCTPAPECAQPTTLCRVKGKWIKDCPGVPTIETPVDLQAGCDSSGQNSINCCGGGAYGTATIYLSCSICKEPE